MKKAKLCHYCKTSGKHEGMTAMMNAVRHGHQECLVAAAGCDPKQKNDLGLTALMLAAVYNRLEMVDQLLPLSDLDAKTPPKTGLGMVGGGLDAEALATPACKALIISYRESKELEEIIGAGGKSKSKSL